MTSKLTIPKSLTSTAKKSTLKRTSTALGELMTQKGLQLTKSRTYKTGQVITKENKTINFYKDNFRQILSLVILENTDETLKNNLKTFYEDVEVRW